MQEEKQYQDHTSYPKSHILTKADHLFSAEGEEHHQTIKQATR